MPLSIFIASSMTLFSISIFSVLPKNSDYVLQAYYCGRIYFRDCMLSFPKIPTMYCRHIIVAEFIFGTVCCPFQKFRPCIAGILLWQNLFSGLFFLSRKKLLPQYSSLPRITDIVGILDHHLRNAVGDSLERILQFRQHPVGNDFFSLQPFESLGIDFFDQT